MSDMSEPRATETTGRNEPKKDVAKPQFRLPRRFFLQGVLVVLAGRALERAAHYLGAEWRTAELPVNWRIGNHFLEESDRRYLLDHPSVIVGETNVWELDSMLPDATIRDRDPNSSDPALLQQPMNWLKAAGGTDENFRVNHNAFVDAREHGSVLVVTDGDFDSSVPGEYFDKEYGPVNTAKTAMILATFGFGPTMLLLRKITKHINKSDAQRGVSGESKLLDSVNMSVVNLLRVPLVASLVEEALGRTVLRQYKAATNLGTEGLYKIADLLTGLLGDKGFVLLDALGRAADASMALNTRTVQEVLRQNPALKDQLSPKGPLPLGACFFAGGGHEDAKDCYESGMEYLSERLKTIADRLIDYYTKELVAEPDQPSDQQDQQEILHSWTFLTSRFGYPIPSFADLLEFQSAPKLDLPDSPRAILYKQLLKRIVKQGDDKGKETGAYWSLFNRLVQEDIRFNSVYERHVAPLRERAIAHRDQAEFTIPFADNTNLVFFEGIPHWIPVSS